MKQSVAFPPVRYDAVRLAGGLDQITPTLALPPGLARRAANFEASVNGGYTRVAGYERFDGHPSPSAGTYGIITLSAAPSVGQTITGVTSGATGKVIAVSGLQVVYTRASGAWTIGETVNVSGSPVGTVTDVIGVTADGYLNAHYLGLAANDYRADIGAVPGSGAVLGVGFYSGTVYAWRNNSAGTAALLYRSSASGWQSVSFGHELAFNTGGTVPIVEGNTVTGATSGATGVVGRVCLQSGTWTGSTAAGRLILTSTTGTFQNAENLNVSGAPRAVAGGAAAQIAMSPGGRFEMQVANFGGVGNQSRLYGCDGVNRAWEFDGTVFAPIVTGMTADTPTHLETHRQSLFLSFGRSVQFSSLGNPFQWSPITGAGEIAMASPVTDLLALPGNQSTGALAIFTESEIAILYGTGSSNFSLTPLNVGATGIAYTAQNLEQTYFLDPRGVMGLATSLNYGNFDAASLTQNIRPFIKARRGLATASGLNREKSQYRVFFSDGWGLYLTIVNGQMRGAMPVQFPNPVTCLSDGPKSAAGEFSYFGSTNGYVYQLDAGNSFDGEPIAFNIDLVYNSTRSPRVLKHYRKAALELTGDAYAAFDFGFALGYRSPDLDQPGEASYDTDIRPSYWDSFSWDNFVWDGRDNAPVEIEMGGTAENVSIRVAGSSALIAPFTVNTLIVHFSPRRGMR